METHARYRVSTSLREEILREKRELLEALETYYQAVRAGGFQ